jgi:kynureninase
MSGFDPQAALERASELDTADPLRAERDLFEIPRAPGDGQSADSAERPAGAETRYFCGNSLGLMPRAAREAVQHELDDWASLGVDAHLRGRTPWFSYHEQFREMGARLVGARAGEVVMMNSLTVNLHLMMVSFYRPEAPDRGRRKILIEDDAFPSDSYAAASQLACHGVDPAEGLIRLEPRAGEQTLHTSDIVAAIEDNRDELALVLLPGVSYLTGQVFDIEGVTAAARDAGVTIGWDLAHAAGNVPLQLHDWGADFACWCGYKYLNGGPGAVAGCFVNDRHAKRTDLPRLAGWWGNDPTTRFQMSPDFGPREGAEGWQISNPPILSMAPLRASMEIFERIGMDALRAKSRKLTGFLADLLAPLEHVRIITPPDTADGGFGGECGGRGCQLSLRLAGADARTVHDDLKAQGVICDFREPDIIRAAPVPLYNTFEDCVRLAAALAR